MKRIIAGFIDALVVAALSATTVLILLSVSGQLKEVGTGLAACTAAFFIGFCDVAIACGALIIVVVIMAGFPRDCLPIWLGSNSATDFKSSLSCYFRKFGRTSYLRQKIFNLKVTARDGSRLNIGTAVWRNAAKILTFITGAMPFLHLAVSNSRQMMHDRVAGTCVQFKHNNLPGEISAAGAVLTQAKIEKASYAGIGRRAAASILDSFLYYAIVEFTLAFFTVSWPTVWHNTISSLIAG